MQAFVEQYVGLFLDVFPGGELTGTQVGTQTGIVLGGLFDTVQVVATTALAGFTIGLEGLGDQIEMVGLGAEVAKLFALLGELGNRLLHRGTIIAVVAVTFHHQRVDLFAAEDVLKGIFDRGRTRAGRTGNGDDGMFYRHITLLKDTEFVACARGKNRIWQAHRHTGRAIEPPIIAFSGCAGKLRAAAIHQNSSMVCSPLASSCSTRSSLSHS